MLSRIFLIVSLLLVVVMTAAEDFNFAKCKEVLSHSGPDKEKQTAAFCIALCGNSPQMRNLCSVNETVNGLLGSDKDADDRFFRVMGLQYARELNCSSQFAGDIIQPENDKKLDLIADKLVAAHAARLEVTSMISIMTGPARDRPWYVPIHCSEFDYTVKDPKTGEYVIDPEVGKKGSERDKWCAEFLFKRRRRDLLLNSLPLGETDLVKDVIQKHTITNPVLTKEEAKQLLKEAYGESSTAFKSQASSFWRKTMSEGGKEISDNTRKMMLLDEALVSKVVSKPGNQDLAKVACEAEDEYGKTAQTRENVRDAALMIGSFAPLVIVRLGRLIPWAMRAYSASTKAQRVGLLSLRVTQGLMISADVTYGLGDVISACYGSDGIDATIKVKNEQCGSAPQIENVERESCAMGAVLAAGTAAVEVAGLTNAAKTHPAIKRLFSKSGGSTPTPLRVFNQQEYNGIVSETETAFNELASVTANLLPTQRAEVYKLLGEKQFNSPRLKGLLGENWNESRRVKFEKLIAKTSTADAMKTYGEVSRILPNSDELFENSREAAEFGRKLNLFTPKNKSRLLKMADEMPDLTSKKEFLLVASNHQNDVTLSAFLERVALRKQGPGGEQKALREINERIRKIDENLPKVKFGTIEAKAMAEERSAIFLEKILIEQGDQIEIVRIRSTNKYTERHLAGGAKEKNHPNSFGFDAELKPGYEVCRGSAPARGAYSASGAIGSYFVPCRTSNYLNQMEYANAVGAPNVYTSIYKYRIREPGPNDPPAIATFLPNSPVDWGEGFRTNGGSFEIMPEQVYKEYVRDGKTKFIGENRFAVEMTDIVGRAPFLNTNNRRILDGLARIRDPEALITNRRLNPMQRRNQAIQLVERERDKAQKILDRSNDQIKRQLPKNPRELNTYLDKYIKDFNDDEAAYTLYRDSQQMAENLGRSNAKSLPVSVEEARLKNRTTVLARLIKRHSDRTLSYSGKELSPAEAARKFAEDEGVGQYRDLVRRRREQMAIFSDQTLSKDSRIRALREAAYQDRAIRDILPFIQQFEYKLRESCPVCTETFLPPEAR